MSNRNTQNSKNFRISTTLPKIYETVYSEAFRSSFKATMTACCRREGVWQFSSFPGTTADNVLGWWKMEWHAIMIFFFFFALKESWFNSCYSLIFWVFRYLGKKNGFDWVEGLAEMNVRHPVAHKLRYVKFH